MTYEQKLNQILMLEDRNAVWLSKKLGCSHTLCYNWLKYKTTVSEKYRIRIKSVFGKKYGI